RAILRRSAALGLAAPVAASLLAACGGGGTPAPAATTGATQTAPAGATAGATPPAEEATGGIINANSTLGDKGIGNPILDQVAYWPTWLVFNRLVKYDDHGTLIADLASDWTYSDDALTLTLTLVETAGHEMGR